MKLKCKTSMPFMHKFNLHLPWSMVSLAKEFLADMNPTISVCKDCSRHCFLQFHFCNCTF